MAPRPHWKGFLKLSLVSCPIALYPAIAAAEGGSFRQVNRQTGHRLRQQLVDSVTGEVVERHDKTRGYEVGEDQFLVVQDEELASAEQEARARPFSVPPAARDAQREQAPASVSRNERPASRGTPVQLERKVAPFPAREQPPTMPPEPLLPVSLPPVPIENNRTIVLDRFFPLDQIDPRYHDTPYYIVPRDKVGQEAFAVIREAMRAKHLVGMGRVVLARRERPLIVEPMRAGLRGITLRFAHEVRGEAEYFGDIPDIELPDEMLRVAEHILETKRADFNPAFLEDRYRTVLVSMLKNKQAKFVPQRVARPSRENVIDLMDVLKRSLDAERPPAPSVAKPTSQRVPAASKISSKKRSGHPRKTG